MATRLLRSGVEDGDIPLPQQAVLEFVSAVSRARPGESPILAPDEASREAEKMLAVFDVLYPTEVTVWTAVRGAGAYGLSWFDAHLWAYAECHGLSELVSEDFSTVS